AELVLKGVKGENLHYYLMDKKVLLELARLLVTYTDRYIHPLVKNGILLLYVACILKRYDEALEWSKGTAKLL
ncbi:hypothetical protein, partial [Methylobacterium crusticola]|uniref:hypothetical protein n=1 Tax=Methylobacterium crusticola TaxID=1697972 RepID=UPI001EE2E8B9